MERRHGVDRIRVRLQRMRNREMIVVRTEADAPAAAPRALSAPEEPFDLWFKGRVAELHGTDPTRPKYVTTPRLVFGSDL